MNPASLPPPPRRVRAKLGGSIWFGRIFLLPHTLIGIGAAGYLLFLLLWQLLGTDIPGTITDKKIQYSSKHGKHYQLTYEYKAGGGPQFGTQNVSPALYQSYHPREATNPPVTVHYFAIGPMKHTALRESGSLWSGIGFMALWTGFWNLVVFIFVYQFWIKPSQAKRLYRYGEAATGTVLDKRLSATRSSTRKPTYYVSYEFREPSSGQTLQNEIQVWNPAAWEQAEDGQIITVLYLRDNPRQNTAYEFGGYRVVDA